MALGRGLGEILSEVEEAYEKDLSDIDSFELEAHGARVEELPIDRITANPFQPRKTASTYRCYRKRRWLSAYRR